MVRYSAFMLMKDAMGLMPQFSMIGMISGMMKVSHGTGWVVHFMVGTVLYGGVFGWLAPIFFDGSWWLAGAALGALGWLMAMVMLMPMSGNGFFGIKLGGMVTVMSFLMHLVFGIVLGWTYGWMIS